jgi:alpha-N-acetylglucosaminidase
LHSNSIVYSYAYDLAWGEPKRPLADWLRITHAPAMADLARSGLGMAAGHRGRLPHPLLGPRWWQEHAGAYLFFKRPTLAGADYPPRPAIRRPARGIAAMLAAAPAHPAPLLTYDLVDLTRHYASMMLDDRLKAALAAYRAGDVARGDKARAAMEQLAATSTIWRAISRKRWAVDRRRARPGDTPAEKARFAQEAKAIVTVWGGRAICPTMPRARGRGFMPAITCRAGRCCCPPARRRPCPPPAGRPATQAASGMGTGMGGR